MTKKPSPSENRNVGRPRHASSAKKSTGSEYSPQVRRLFQDLEAADEQRVRRAIAGLAKVRPSLGLIGLTVSCQRAQSVPLRVELIAALPRYATIAKVLVLSVLASLLDKRQPTEIRAAAMAAIVQLEPADSLATGGPTAPKASRNLIKTSSVPRE